MRKRRAVTLLEFAIAASIAVVPVLLREGIRLFENMGTKRVELERERVIESSGVTHIKLRVVK